MMTSPRAETQRIRQMERELGYDGRIHDDTFIRPRPGYGCSWCRSTDGMERWTPWRARSVHVAGFAWYEKTGSDARYTLCPWCEKHDLSEYERVSAEDVARWCAVPGAA